MTLTGKAKLAGVIAGGDAFAVAVLTALAGGIMASTRDGALARGRNFAAGDVAYACGFAGVNVRCRTADSECVTGQPMTPASFAFPVSVMTPADLPCELAGRSSGSPTRKVIASTLANNCARALEMITADRDRNGFAFWSR